MNKPIFTIALVLLWIASTSAHPSIAQVTIEQQTPPAARQDRPQDEAPDGPYFDIGKFTCPVTTNSREAQLWFDRGLAMCHAFNHEEAARCFENAILADPKMAMAYWGLAYAWGPNINNMQIATESIAQAALALRLAKLHSTQAGPWEAALIDAMEGRYTIPVPEDRAPLNEKYATAMRQVYKKFGEQPLVVALFAEALMDLRPWQLWSPDGAPADVTPELVSVLEQGLRRWPNHPMLCHLYIHAIEASPAPEQALDAAVRLGDLMPGAGHLVHMPSHIYIRLGDYPKVIDCNQRAISVDKEFVRRHGMKNFFTIYRAHNFHFLVYGAMFDGQSQLALKTARELVDQIPVEMLKAQPDMIEAFIPTVLHVMVRFGKWEDILREPEPADYLPVTRAIWHYARGLAFASTGKVAEAEVEQQKFLEAQKLVPETSMLFQNKSLQLLQVAERMLEGEIAYRKQRYDEAFDALRAAVALDDGLNYDEPWGWMQPARHALGALLLEQGKWAEAESVFRIDLKRHPKNPWALQGLEESLRKQGDVAAADAIAKELQLATARADVKIDRACYCKLTAGK